jgi:hypothetical protein
MKNHLSGESCLPWDASCIPIRCAVYRDTPFGLFPPLILPLHIALTRKLYGHHHYRVWLICFFSFFSFYYIDLPFLTFSPFA